MKQSSCKIDRGIARGNVPKKKLEIFLSCISLILTKHLYWSVVFALVLGLQNETGMVGILADMMRGLEHETGVVVDGVAFEEFVWSIFFTFLGIEYLNL